MSDSKPYELPVFFEKGDRVGWVDRSGTVHVETTEDVHGSTVIEVESPIRIAYAAIAAALDIAKSLTAPDHTEGGTP